MTKGDAMDSYARYEQGLAVICEYLFAKRNRLENALIEKTNVMRGSRSNCKKNSNSKTRVRKSSKLDGLT